MSESSHEGPTSRLLDLITFEAIQEDEPAPCIELMHQWCKDIYMAAFDVEDRILRLLGLHGMTAGKDCIGPFADFGSSAHGDEGTCKAGARTFQTNVLQGLAYVSN